MKCKICGSDSFRMRYGKYQCNQCGARYGPDSIQGSKPPVSVKTSKASERKEPQRAVSKPANKGIPWKMVAVAAACLIAIGAVAILLLK
jgi:uncharacterized membrane protein YvbJ